MPHWSSEKKRKESEVGEGSAQNINPPAKSIFVFVSHLVFLLSFCLMVQIVFAQNTFLKSFFLYPLVNSLMF